MGGVGVYAAKVVVIGAGVSGMNAAAIALGMQAEVLLLDNNIDKLREADRIYQGHLQTVASSVRDRACCARCRPDHRCGAGAGAKAPTLISNDLVSRMRPGSVLVDIAIDQGGCFEDSRPTTHAEPTFRARLGLHCVANMPGAVPNTSTYALTNVTLPCAEPCRSRWHDALRPTRPRSGTEHLRRVTDQRTCRRSPWPTRPRPGRRLELSAVPTPESAIRAFLDHLAVERGVSKHTALAYRRDLARYADYLAERRLSDLNAVTSGTISDYAGSLREGVREGDGWRQPPWPRRVWPERLSRCGACIASPTAKA